MKKYSLSLVLQKLLGLLLFLLPWQTIWITQERFLNGEKWQYGTQGFYATEVLLWIAVIFFIFWWWRRVKFKIQNSKFKISFSKDRIFLLFCLSFIVYSLFSTIWALDWATAYQHAFYILEAFMLFFMLYLGPLQWKSAAKWFVAGAVLQSIFGIWQFLAQTTFDFKWPGLAGHPVVEAGTSIIAGEGIGRTMRAYGSFSHPNVFGGYLAVSLLFTLLLTFGKQGKGFSWRTFGLWTMVYGLQLTALFFTFSRSAWLAFAVVFLSLITYYIFKKKVFSLQSSVFSLSFIIIVVLAILYFPLVKTRIAGESAHEIASTSERVGGYNEAIEIFKQHPWLGVGSGNFTVAAYELDPWRPGWEYQPVHFVPLLVLVELGLVGMLIFIGIIVSFITYHISQTRKKKLEIWDWKFGITLFPFIFLLVFDHYLFSSYIGLLLSAIYFSLVFRFLETKKHSG
ncbi:MAG: O-antigen ligase family protein [Candidatus Magasanikbacteria bacterium]